jgi:DNA-binding transcriptional MerR regulator
MEGNKIYFSIREVAQMFNIRESTLRFWEKEFDVIHPKTNDKGVRFYKQEDIKDIRLIYFLLKEQGLTIKGAHRQLASNRDNLIWQEELNHRLKRIKKELLALKEALDAVRQEE